MIKNSHKIISFLWCFFPITCINNTVVIILNPKLSAIISAITSLFIELTFNQNIGSDPRGLSLWDLIFIQKFPTLEALSLIWIANPEKPLNQLVVLYQNIPSTCLESLWSLNPIRRRIYLECFQCARARNHNARLQQRAWNFKLELRKWIENYLLHLMRRSRLSEWNVRPWLIYLITNVIQLNNEYLSMELKFHLGSRNFTNSIQALRFGILNKHLCHHDI